MVRMQMLSKEEMVEVLMRPRNALVKQYRQLFRAADTDFKITNGALEQVPPPPPFLDDLGHGAHIQICGLVGEGTRLFMRV